MKFLIARGAEVNTEGITGKTPLQIAAAEGHEEVVELLIAEGAEVSLHSAARLGDLARVESLRKLGFSYKQLEEMGIMLPVLENKTKFHRPAKYDELLTIKTTIPEKPALKMRFLYEVFNEQDMLITNGSSVNESLKYLLKNRH